MPPDTATLVRVEESSGIGEARRVGVSLSERLGMAPAVVSNLAIVLTELATNLVRHARGGSIVLQPMPDRIEVLALDRGPGMADVARCIQDGYSTIGTPGEGLGAIRRLSQGFEAFSAAGAGAVIRCAFPFSGGALGRHETAVGAVAVAMPGEAVCGDGWAVQAEAGRIAVIVADGLGHGLLASEAAGEAVRAFHTDPFAAPGAVLDRVHGALRSTRGAAVSVAQVSAATNEVRFAGIGNVAGAVVGRDASARRMISHNGIVGHQAGKIHELAYPWPDGGRLILHSDGLSSSWDLNSYPGVLARHPEVIAGVLFRDFRRGRDDASVVVAELAWGNGG